MKKTIYLIVLISTIIFLYPLMVSAESPFDNDNDYDIDGVDLGQYALEFDGQAENIADFAALFGTHQHYTSYSLYPNYKKENLLEIELNTQGLTPPFTYNFTKITKNSELDELPAGIDMDTQSGVLSWPPTPSQTGLYLFNLEITDSADQTTSQIIEVDVLMPGICNSSNSACQFLLDKFSTNQAAGNIGDWYHNSDRFHSNLNLTELPQVDLMATDSYTGQYYANPERVIIGNSSTAYTSGDSWCSLQRYIMLYSYRASSVYNQYINNNHYWYPEHRDHDATDHYHGKAPFVSSSQGSSGSEMDEVKNFIYTLAAFKPDVKERLVADGLLIPTVQMIFRRVRVQSDSEYLSGAAHPSAFDNYDGRLAMVEMANSINSDNIPPMVQISVLNENYGVFEGKTEKWFDTPVSVCRIFRGHEYTKYIEIDAGDSYDLNDRPLTYHWVVLRGDSSNVRISYLNQDHSRARIEFDYHPQTTIEDSTKLTNMVEVGVFVHNGVYYSAPGFVTSFTLNNEERTYNQSGDLTDIQYNSNYVHPRLQN